MLTIFLHQRQFVSINRWKFQLNSMLKQCSTISYRTTLRWIFESNINYELNIFRSKNDQNSTKKSNRISTENLLILWNRSRGKISHRNEKNIDNIGFYIVDFQPSIYLHEEMFEKEEKKMSMRQILLSCWTISDRDVNENRIHRLKDLLKISKSIDRCLKLKREKFETFYLDDSVTHRFTSCWNFMLIVNYGFS